MFCFSLPALVQQLDHIFVDLGGQVQVLALWAGRNVNTIFVESYISQSYAIFRCANAPLQEALSVCQLVSLSVRLLAMIRRKIAENDLKSIKRPKKTQRFAQIWLSANSGFIFIIHFLRLYELDIHYLNPKSSCIRASFWSNKGLIGYGVGVGAGLR